MTEYLEILNSILAGEYSKDVDIPVIGKAKLVVKTNGPVEMRCTKQRTGFDINFLGNKPRVDFVGRFILKFPGTLEKIMVRNSDIEIDIRGLPNIKIPIGE